MTVDEVLARLRTAGDPAAVEGMARFGINPEKTLGVSVPKLRALAKEVGRDHALARALWKSGVHEARILAPMIEEPARVTEAQIERWVRDLDSWDVCDGFCLNLLDRLPIAWEKAVAWSARPEEFVKRAGFVLMARLAVRQKTAPDERFLAFLPIVEREADDRRNFVKKGVNWALRQIGKRNLALNRAAIACGERLARRDSAAARWIARDALRELRDEKVQARLAARS
jgi:3-methyladenine DNA glycosylase AlkD